MKAKLNTSAILKDYKKFNEKFIEIVMKNSDELIEVDKFSSIEPDNYRAIIEGKNYIMAPKYFTLEK